MNKKNNKTLLYFIGILLVGILIGFGLGSCRSGNGNGQVVVNTPLPTETTTVEATTTPNPEPTQTPTIEPTPTEELLDEHGTYDSKDDVALYIHQYNKLPDNFMTKAEARKYGWEGGALNRVVEGMCIGGDVYSNFEGNLPDIDGTYYECDIDTLTKKKRGAKRIVFSDEGDIYYTNDHYETFELLYGDGEGW